MDETQRPHEQDPLPRSFEAVDWWLTKWGRQTVVDRHEPLTRQDVERLIEANGGTAEGLDLHGRDIRGANLQQANLQGAGLINANLEGAMLWTANLQGAYLVQANLQGANFQGAKLHAAILWSANLQGADLCGVDLKAAELVWANLRSADLRNADLQGASLREAKLQGALLTGARISPDTILEGVEWDSKYISALERGGDYEAASAVYRRLKEWYRGAGMLTIAGEFHYREQEASHKAHGQRLVWQFKEGLAAAWRRLKGGDGSAPTKE